MDSFLEEKKEKKGINKGFLIAIPIAALLILGIIGAIALMPSTKEKKENLMAGAFFEGSPEFDEYEDKIIVIADANSLQETRTMIGGITMIIGGRIRNIGDKTITGLQVRVGMIDTKNKVIKDREVIVIPRGKYTELKPNDTIAVSINVSGFEENDDRANSRWKITGIKFKE